MRINDDQLRAAIKAADGATDLVRNEFFQSLITALVSDAENGLMNVDLKGSEGGHNAITAIMRWRIATELRDIPASRVRQAQAALDELNKRET